MISRSKAMGMDLLVTIDSTFCSLSVAVNRNVLLKTGIRSFLSTTFKAASIRCVCSKILVSSMLMVISLVSKYSAALK